MRQLIDTHSFLWFVWDDSRLSEKVAARIEDPSVETFISAASLWEIAIKVSLGKLILAQPLDQFLPNQLDQNGFALLPITLTDVCRVSFLPFHHRDPFDRMIAAQCLERDLPLLSADPAFDTYGVQRIW